jgi:hypothetical protein
MFIGGSVTVGVGVGVGVGVDVGVGVGVGVRTVCGCVCARIMSVRAFVLASCIVFSRPRVMQNIMQQGHTTCLQQGRAICHAAAGSAAG